MKNLTYCLLALILLACSEKEQSKNDIPTIRLDPAKAVDELKLSDLIDTDIEIIPLETNDSSLVGMLDKVKFTDNYIFILDRFNAKSVWMFNRDGSFVRKIGRSGKGPGEFSTPPLDISITDSEIKILLGRSILSYDYDGNFLGDKELSGFSAFDMQQVEDSVFGFIGGGRDDNLILTTEGFSRVNSYFPYQSSATNLIINNPFVELANSNKVVFRKHLLDTLYTITNDYQIEPYKLLDFGSLGNIQETLMNSGLSGEALGQKYEEIKDRFCITNFYLESGSGYFIGFSYDERVFLAIGAHDSKPAIVYYENLINDVTFDPRSYPADVAGNYMAMVVRPINLKETIDAFDGPENHPFYQQMKPIADQASEEDNPIFVLCKFK